MLGKKSLAGKKKETKKEENQSLSLASECIRILDNKGFDSDALFHEAKTEVSKLKKELEKGRITQLAGIDPIIVGGLLRNVLTDKPLIGSEFYDQFRAIADKMNDQDAATQLSRHLISNSDLADVKPVFHQLIVLLKKISSYSDKNKLDVGKLASTFASCLVKKKSTSTAPEPNDDPAIRSVVTFMISHVEAIFGGEPLQKEAPPSELHQTQTVSTDDGDEEPDVDESQEALVKKSFFVFSPDIFESFAKMMALARERNVSIEVPQICIIGAAEHGKTSFLESLLGHKFSSNKSRKSKRPVVITIVNNPQAQRPIFKFKADTVAGLSDEEVNLNQLPAELDKRNVASETPIFLTYEFNLVFNMVIIDTVPLVDDPNANRHALESAQSCTFLVYCFKNKLEEKMVELVQRVDPKLVKTTFVHTDFSTNLKTFITASDLNPYLAATCQFEVPTYLTTLVSESVDENATDDVGAAFKNKLWQSQQNDFSVLDRLSYDKQYEQKVGIFKCRKVLVEGIWKRYQDFFPELPKNILNAQKNSEGAIKLVALKLKNSEASKLREVATAYANDFLKNIEKLMVGSLEGVPAINGQTLDEEKSQQQDGTGWISGSCKPVTLKEEFSIPTGNAKLYGKQQFERVLAEFKSVVEHMASSPITMDDVATAAGSYSIAHKNLSLFAWVASDLAAKAATNAFTPLIEELHTRLLYVMLRSIPIADAMQGYKAKADAATSKLSSNEIKYDFQDFPYLTSTVKHFYTTFVKECAQVAHEKALQELYCTKILYWEHLNFGEKKLVQQDIKTSEEARKAVVVLSTEMYNDIRKRLARNVMMKYYEYLLVPVQSKLSQIQNKVTCLADAQIDELFQVQTLKKSLQAEEAKLKAQHAKLKEQYQSFLDNASKFKRGSGL